MKIRFLGFNLRKALLISGLAISISILAIVICVVIVLLKIDNDEHYHSVLAEQSREFGNQLEEYKRVHKYLPDTLAQAGIQEKVCLNLGYFGSQRCTVFHYKVLNNRQDFTLAANASKGFVVTYNGISGNYKDALILSESSYGAEFPRYGSISDWPVLEEN